MTIKLSFLGFASALLFLSSCASQYRSINPESLQYTAKSSNDGIDLGYRYAVLQDKDNKKYAKKEVKTGIKVVALNITNHSDRDLVFGKNMRLFSGDTEVPIVEHDIVARKLRQNAPAYLAYLLLCFVNVYVDNGFERKTYPVGLVLGPAITIGNAATASSSNKRFYQELARNNLLNKTIKPGETMSGLVGVRISGFNPLSLRVN